MTKTLCLECMREVELPPLGVMCADCNEKKPKFYVGQWVRKTDPPPTGFSSPCYGLVTWMRQMRGPSGLSWHVYFENQQGRMEAHEGQFELARATAPAPAAQ